VRRKLNEERRWARKQKHWEEQQKAQESVEKETEAKRRRTEEGQHMQPAIFQPSATALTDPAAYFSEWQQFSLSQKNGLRQQKGRGGGKGRVPLPTSQSFADEHSNPAQCHMAVAASTIGSSVPNQAHQPKKIQNGSGFGLLSTYDSDSDE